MPPSYSRLQCLQHFYRIDSGNILQYMMKIVIRLQAGIRYKEKVRLPLLIPGFIHTVLTSRKYEW
jgi:hypothetical protein